VLDTNVCVDLLNSPALAGPRIGASAKLLVPIVVFGELLYGAYNSKRVHENLQRIADFTKLVQVIYLDWQTAEQFGRVRQGLLQKGKTIPDDDMWIAAVALERRVSLVTRDRHFKEVDGLQVIPW
jgi:tRNA(fMet)-specific endonuclease VapC